MDVLVPLLDSIAHVSGLPRDQVRPDCELDDLGIDSLAAAEVLVDLELRLGRELPVNVLRRLRTVRTVAEIAAALGEVPAVPAALP